MSDKPDQHEPVPSGAGDGDALAETDLSAGIPASLEADDGSILDLMLPDALPVELALAPSEGAALHRLLSDAVEAFRLEHHIERLRRIEEIMDALPVPDMVPAEVATTGLPLTAFQVSDYDRYFRVNRIVTGQPHLGLVHSFLQTARAVTALFVRSDHLSEMRVRQQIEGFVTHAHLLARTFGLEKLQ